MLEEEKYMFWYGYFEKLFYDKKGKICRIWVGFNIIIGGYIVILKVFIKEEIKSLKKMMKCLICEGMVLNYYKLFKFGNVDICEIIN